MEDRHLVLCECGGATQIVILTVPADHSFIPYYNVALGAQINSKEDKRTRMKELGVMSVGDARMDEVEKEAAWNKKYESDKKSREEFPVFLKSYNKIKTKSAAGTL